MRLLQISDTHLRSTPGEAGYPDPAERLDIVLRAVRGHGFVPDAVVLSGDIADDGTLGAVEAAAAAVAPLGPVVAVPGNHDDPGPVRTVFGDPWLDLGEVLLIGADTTIRGETAGTAAPLARVVAAAPDDRQVVVVGHHPVRSRSAHPWFVFADQGLVHAALAERPPLALLSGHTHEPYAAPGPAGVPLLGAPSTFYGIAHDAMTWERADGTTGALLITIDAGEVRHEVLLA